MKLKEAFDGIVNRTNLETAVLRATTVPVNHGSQLANEQARKIGLKLTRQTWALDRFRILGDRPKSALWLLMFLKARIPR